MAKPMTVGILGTGEIATKAAISLLEDLTEISDPVHFVFAADGPNWTPVAQDIAEFLHANDVTFDLVVDDSSDPGEDYLKAAQTVIKVARPGIGVVRQLERAEGEKRLVVLFSDGDEDGLKAVERAIDKGISALDLTSGLEALVFGDDGAAAASESDDEPEEASAPAEPAKRRRRTKVEMEAARAAEAAAAAPVEAQDDEEDDDDGAVAEEKIRGTACVTTSGGFSPTLYEALSSAVKFHEARDATATDVIRSAEKFAAFLQG